MTITPGNARRAVRPTIDRLLEARDPLGLEKASRHEGADPLHDLVEAMLPVPPTTGAAVQAARNATARAEFFAAFPTLTSREVAMAAGSGARNAAALANRWRSEGRIFAVSWGNSLRYPAFQFDQNGAPLPIIKSVLDELEAVATPWQICLWFASPSPHMPNDDRPLDLLSDAETVVAAAKAERNLPDF